MFTCGLDSNDSKWGQMAEFYENLDKPKKKVFSWPTRDILGGFLRQSTTSLCPLVHQQYSIFTSLPVRKSLLFTL